MIIEHRDFRITIGWKAGLAIIILAGLLIDLIAAIHFGEPELLMNSGQLVNLQVDQANNTIMNNATGGKPS